MRSHTFTALKEDSECLVSSVAYAVALECTHTHTEAETVCTSS